MKTLLLTSKIESENADIRAQQLRRIISDAGHEVVCDKSVSDCDLIVATPAWDALDGIDPGSAPLVLDLSESRFESNTKSKRVFDPERKLKAIARADLILCSSKAAQIYYYGWLVQAGRVPKDRHLIHVLPAEPSETELAPLYTFLNKPQKAAPCEPAIGAVYPRPKFLRCQGEEIEIPLLADAIEQQFVLPAENIGAIELRVRKLQQGTDVRLESLNLELRGTRGELVARRNIPARDLPEAGPVWLKLPALFQLPGGRKYTLSVKAESKAQNDALIAISGLNNASFPLISDNVRSPSTNLSSETSHTVDPQLMLCFVPAEASKIYRAKLRARRAAQLVMQGEWKRLYRAISKRLV